MEARITKEDQRLADRYADRLERLYRRMQTGEVPQPDPGESQELLKAIRELQAYGEGLRYRRAS